MTTNNRSGSAAVDLTGESTATIETTTMTHLSSIFLLHHHCYRLSMHISAAAATNKPVNHLLLHTHCLPTIFLLKPPPPPVWSSPTSPEFRWNFLVWLVPLVRSFPPKTRFRSILRWLFWWKWTRTLHSKNRVQMWWWFML